MEFTGDQYSCSPMWSHLGASAEGHGGSRHLKSRKARANTWKSHDRVLARSALLPCLRDDDVKTLHTDVRTGELLPLGETGAIGILAPR